MCECDFSDQSQVKDLGRGMRVVRRSPKHLKITKIHLVRPYTLKVREEQSMETSPVLKVSLYES